jgi:hypothetical protein
LIFIAAAGVSATFCSRSFHPIRCDFAAFLWEKSSKCKLTGRENGSRGALGQHRGAHFGRKLIDVFRVPEVVIDTLTTRARDPNKTTATNAIIRMRMAISQEKTQIRASTPLLLH